MKIARPKGRAIFVCARLRIREDERSEDGSRRPLQMKIARPKGRAVSIFVQGQRRRVNSTTRGSS
jgi:hypothetical protein